MASGFRNAAGVDTDDLYDPDLVGAGPQATGFRRADGATLRYASATYGTPGDAMGFRLSDGRDIGPLWAKKGTASYWSVIHQEAPGYNRPTTSGVAWIGSAECRITFSPDGYLRQQSLRNGSWQSDNTSKFVTGSNAASGYQVRLAWAITQNRYTGTGTAASFIGATNGAAAFQAIGADRQLYIQNGSGYVYNDNFPITHGDVIITVTVDLQDPSGRITTQTYTVRMDMYGTPQPD